MERWPTRCSVEELLRLAPGQHPGDGRERPCRLCAPFGSRRGVETPSRGRAACPWPVLRDVQTTSRQRRRRHALAQPATAGRGVASRPAHRGGVLSKALSRQRALITVPRARHLGTAPGAAWLKAAPGAIFMVGIKPGAPGCQQKPRRTVVVQTIVWPKATNIKWPPSFASPVNTGYRRPQAAIYLYQILVKSGHWQASSRAPIASAVQIRGDVAIDVRRFSPTPISRAPVNGSRSYSSHAQHARHKR